MDKRLEYIRHAMECYKSDDLERAKLAFHGLSPEEMKQEHGCSGQSRQEILNYYEKDRDLWTDSMALLERCLPEMRGVREPGSA
jgi:hypothetical protein